MDRVRTPSPLQAETGEMMTDFSKKKSRLLFKKADLGRA
jgi:hypothetical protein